MIKSCITATLYSIPQLSASARAVSDADRGLMRAARRLRNAAEPSGRPIVSAARAPPTAPQPTAYYIHTSFTHRQGRAFSFPSPAGEGGAKRRMGYGPLHEPQSACTNVTANLSSTRPCFPHPSWRCLPRFAEGEFMSGAAPHECAR